MASVKRPCSFTIFTMNIPGFICPFIITHHHHIAFEGGFSECSSLTHKSFYCGSVILGEHTRYRIKFGRKCKEGKIIGKHWYLTRHGVVNIGIFVNVWVLYELKIFKSKAMLIV